MRERFCDESALYICSPFNKRNCCFELEISFFGKVPQNILWIYMKSFSLIFSSVLSLSLFLHFFSSSVLHSVFFISLSLKIDHLHCRKSRFVLLTHLSSHITKNSPKSSPCTDQGSCAIIYRPPRDDLSLWTNRGPSSQCPWEARRTWEFTSAAQRHKNYLVIFRLRPSVLLEMPRVWDESSLLQERSSACAAMGGNSLGTNSFGPCFSTHLTWRFFEPAKLMRRLLGGVRGFPGSQRTSYRARYLWISWQPVFQFCSCSTDNRPLSSWL